MFLGFRPVLTKEWIQIRRDRFTLFLIFIVPMFQLLIFGYAINTNVRDIKTVVYNLDHRQPSRQLLTALTNTDYFEIIHHVHSDRELDRWIVAGRAKVGIKIPADYSERLLRGNSSAVLVLIDGSDSTVASQAITASTAVGLRKSLEILAQRLAEQDLDLPVKILPKMLFNPDMRSANFMVPGLIAIILQMITAFLTAFSIVRERERGTLEQLLVTPVTPAALILGKLTPYCLIAFTETCAVLLVMRFLFQVPIHGNLPFLLATAIVFLFTALGIGMLITTRVQNQVQAMQMAYFIMLPSILLSGFLFPLESMPQVMRWLGYTIPATYFIEIMRGIVLRGAGPLELWPNVVILLLMATLFIVLSTLRFQKHLE